MKDKSYPRRSDERRKGWHITVEFKSRHVVYRNKTETFHKDGTWDKMYDEPELSHGVFAHRPWCCHRGMHASKKLLNALRYLQNYPTASLQICRVEVAGDIDTVHDKFCGKYRRVLYWVNYTDIADEFRKHIKNWKNNTTHVIEARDEYLLRLLVRVHHNINRNDVFERIVWKAIHKKYKMREK